MRIRNKISLFVIPLTILPMLILGIFSYQSLLKGFEEDVYQYSLYLQKENFNSNNILYHLNWKEDVLNALKLNVRDYYHKSNIFDGIVLGLSGGIDSAFTAYICAQAIGAEKINAIMMPTRFTSKESLDLSKKFCLQVSEFAVLC